MTPAEKCSQYRANKRQRGLCLFCRDKVRKGRKRNHSVLQT